MTKRCAICDELLTEKNNHREHVIPEALGGRRAIHGFICRPCNNRTGTKWDAPLIEALHQLAVLVGVAKRPTLFGRARYEGDLPSDGEIPEEFREDNLGRVRKSPDGKTETADYHFSHKKGPQENRIHMTVPPSKLKKELRQLRKKYPQIRDEDVTIRDIAEKGGNWIGFTAFVSGRDMGRALAKMAVALAVGSGVNPKDCEKSEEYLKKDGKPCVAYFYDPDPVRNRVEGMPVHVVHVQGDPNRGQLIGYVELFGCVRVIVCLSSNYGGEPIHCSYAINPRSGNTENVEIDLHCSPERIDEMCERGELPLSSYLNALTRIVAALETFEPGGAIQLELGWDSKTGIFR